MITRTTATVMASPKPFRKMAPSTISSAIVTRIGCCIHSGASGFSIRCAAASAADSVMVMTKLVAAKPSRHSTTTLPFQRGNRFSSIRMLPWPCGLISATRLYIGSAPNSVSSTRTSVAIGESVPAAMNAMPGW